MNDVCLRQMMTASPNDVRYANDVCLRAHRGKHRIIAKRSGATSYLRSKCIISPQAMLHCYSWTDPNRHIVGDDLPGVPINSAQTSRRGRRPLQFKNYLQTHRCNGILNRSKPPHRRGAFYMRPQGLNRQNGRIWNPPLQILFTKP